MYFDLKYNKSHSYRYNGEHDNLIKHYGLEVKIISVTVKLFVVT